MSTRRSGRDDEHERRMVGEAMDRLLAGQPIRSDGKLTITSLAAEAGIKRWLLTHRHTDLQQEFRARARTQDETPTATRQLTAENDELKTRLEELSRRVADLDAENKRLARIVQVLTLENEQLAVELTSRTHNVTSIRPSR